jgi:serine/threonine protein kinase
MDRRTFLSYLQRSGLLNKSEIKEVLKRVPYTDRGKAIARALVEQGVLTRFQAQLILIGRYKGFHIGQYRILEQIGKGGMGHVYKAVHLPMNRVVALKVLAPQHLKTERARQLFEREVCAIARLAHPNIVTAYDASVADGRHYLVLEYVEGPNLEQLVRELGPLPVGVACDIIRQAAAGLQYAHERGMVHRDVKPSNLLVQSTGPGAAGGCVVKILDFGLARLGDPGDGGKRPGTILVRDNTVMGTPDYVSPEQARNLHDVDIRSDLYSLGCTFYYLLSGRVPFPGGTSVDKLLRHMNEAPAPVQERVPDLPEPVSAIVHRLLAKDPADRFQTPAELIDALTPHAKTSATSWQVGAGGVIAFTDTETTPVNTGTSRLDEVGGFGLLDGFDLSPRPRPQAPEVTLEDLRVLQQQGSGGRRLLFWALLLTVGLAALSGVLFLINS